MGDVEHPQHAEHQVQPHRHHEDGGGVGEPVEQGEPDEDPVLDSQAISS